MWTPEFEPGSAEPKEDLVDSAVFRAFIQSTMSPFPLAAGGPMDEALWAELATRHNEPTPAEMPDQPGNLPSH